MELIYLRTAKNLQVHKIFLPLFIFIFYFSSVAQKRATLLKQSKRQKLMESYQTLLGTKLPY
jgi:hypothetical protein